MHQADSFAVEGFAGVKQVGRLTRYRLHKRSRKQSVETVYLITNLAPEEAGAAQVLAWIQRHWVIENSLHHVLDVLMYEDTSSSCQEHAPRMLAALSNARRSACLSDEVTTLSNKQQNCFEPSLPLPLNCLRVLSRTFGGPGALLSYDALCLAT